MGWLRGMAEAVEAMKQGSFRTIGVLFDGPDSAYAVYEIKIGTGGVEVTRLAVTPFRRIVGHTWGMTLTGEVEGLAQALRAATQAGQQGPSTAEPTPQP